MTHVYYTVNSGLYFSCGDAGVFIDGIHKGTDVGFSPVHPKTLSDCEKRIGIFENLKALLFTHCHSDHYDADSAGRLLLSGPLFLFSPETPVSDSIPGITVSKEGPGGTLRMLIGETEIFAVKTRHDGGRPLCFTPHVSFVINAPDATFFAAGDGVFTEEDAGTIRSLCRGRMKAAFVNPYQILLKSDREFLAALDSKCHVLVHLPQAKDDKYNAKNLYDNSVKKYPEQLPELLLPGFYSQVF